MTTTSTEPKVQGALAALTTLGREGVDRPTTEDLDRGLDTLFARIAADKPRNRGAFRWSLVGAAALCVLVGLFVVSLSRDRAPAPEPPLLAYQIEGGSVLEGGYLREIGHAGVKLLFNEGSKVVLTPGTRGRLRTVDREGARVAIDHGTASFQVTRSEERRWLVEVGPFVVTVKGTVFLVAWDPSSERFELSLQRGRVVVSGPVSGGDIALRAGQRLVVNLPKAETLITEERLENVSAEPIPAPASPALGPPAVVPPPARPPVVRDKSPGSTPAATSAGAKPDGERRWADALVSGQWDRILEDAERVGVTATLEKASGEELLALADAARYRRRPDLARAALLAERRRFPSSPRSMDALFLLGRVEELRDSGTARAIGWYDEYLAHAPKGAFAAEALGRKMILTDQLEGPAQARPIAEEYLRRFPRGSYAGSARVLRRVP